MNILPFYTFNVDASADDEEPNSAQLDIYDAIGNFEEFGEISAKAFARDLAKLPTSVKRLDIHINSPGGSLYDAQAIYSRLADHRSTKHVYIDGLAASAASIVAMVGHKVFMRSNASLMIHLPMGLTIGNELDHEKSMRTLRSLRESMINTYTRKTGLDHDEIFSMLKDETWFTADEAVDKGFADEVRGVVKAAASFDLSKFKYKHVPAFTATTTESKPMKPKATSAAEATPPEKKESDNDNGGEEQIPTLPKREETPAPPAQPPPPPPPPAAAQSEFERGAQAERERVTALQALDRPATHDIIITAIKDGKQVTDVVAQCLDAMDKAGVQAARHADARSLNNVPPADGADADNNFGALLTRKVKARLKTRGQRAQLQSRN